MGFVRDDYAHEAVEVWPENWPAWCLWCEVGNQWRIGPAGPVALDYVPLFARLDRRAANSSDWDELFADVRVIEAAALAQMARNRAST